MKMSKETYGVCIWTGESSLPSYQRHLLTLNSTVFKTLYFIADEKELEVPGVVRLDSKILDTYFDRLGAGKLGGNFKADILSLDAIAILKIYGIYLDRVLKIDTDYLVYNKYMLQELFTVDKPEFFLVRDVNYNISRRNRTYFNFGAVFNVQDDETEEFCRDSQREAIKFVGNYTDLGPRLINSLLDANACFHNSEKIGDWIEPLSVDPCTLTEVTKVHLQTKSLGVHLLDSIVGELGWVIRRVEFKKNDLIIYLA